MKVHGTIRSTAGWEQEGSGPTASIARGEAVKGLPEDFELVDVQTVSAKPGEPVTMKAFARSTSSARIQAEGADQATALTALLAQVPDGHKLLSHVIDD